MGAYEPSLMPTVGTITFPAPGGRSEALVCGGAQLCLQGEAFFRGLWPLAAYRSFARCGCIVAAKRTSFKHDT